MNDYDEIYECEDSCRFQECVKLNDEFHNKEENNNNEFINKKKKINNIPDNSYSTHYTDSQYLISSTTNREKNKYDENSRKYMGRKRKIEKNLNYKKPKKSKTDESNVRRKIITHFQDFLYQKLKRKVKKISYKVYTRESINYLKNVFKMKIYTFFKQKVNEKGKNKPNNDILNELMKDKNTRNFLERNFLDVFYNDFVPILTEEYRKEKNIDDKEFKVWKKIIEYKPKKKKIKEYNNEYEKYGFYQYINEKKERKAQNKYKIVENIFIIEKIKRDRNLDIKSDNKVCNEINYLNRDIQINNNELYLPSFPFSSDLFNFEQEFHHDLFDFENINNINI